MKAPSSTFDATYRKDNVVGHERALARLNSEIAGGKESKLVTYAKMTKPTVEQHQTLARARPLT